MNTIQLGRVTLCATLALAAASPWAQAGWYAGMAGGGGGGADVELDPAQLVRFLDAVTQEADVGPVALGAVGYAFGNRTRIEGEIAWRNNALSGPAEGDTSNLSFMLNGAYDVPLDSRVTQFTMGGVGISIFEYSDIDLGTLNLSSIEDDATVVFAWQAGTGLRFAATPSISLELSYRFFGTAEPDFDGSLGDIITTINNTHHNGLVGVTYSF